MRPRWCTWWCCPAVFGVFRSCRLGGGEIRQSTAQTGKNYTIPAEAGRKFQVSRVGEESLRTHAGERGRSPRSTAEAASGATVYRRDGDENTRLPRRRRPDPIRPPGPTRSQSERANRVRKTALAGKVPETSGENRKLVPRGRRYQKRFQRGALSTNLVTRAPGTNRGLRKIRFGVASPFADAITLPNWKNGSGAGDTILIS